MSDQCCWFRSVAAEGKSLRCVLAERHEGHHEAYDGRWSQGPHEFYCAPPVCLGTDSATKVGGGT